jgi:hypothetical protein
MELLQVLPSPVVNGYEETTDSGDCTPANPPASSSAASTAGTGSSIGMGSAQYGTTLHGWAEKQSDHIYLEHKKQPYSNTCLIFV